CAVAAQPAATRNATKQKRRWQMRLRRLPPARTDVGAIALVIPASLKLLLQSSTDSSLLLKRFSGLQPIETAPPVVSSQRYGGTHGRVREADSECHARAGSWARNGRATSEHAGLVRSIFQA